MARMLILTCDNPECENGYNIKLHLDGISNISELLPPGWTIIKVNNTIDELGSTETKLYCRECSTLINNKKELELYGNRIFKN